MIKNVYFCVAKTKIDNPEGSFWIILLGTDRLEELFGNLRTMIGNDAHLDILQLSWRLSSTAEVANILAKYPHWDRLPRRLKLPALTLNGEPLPASSDHLKPRSWRGNVSVACVTLQTSWARGRRIIEQEFPEVADHLKQLEVLMATSDSERFDILSPCGKPLVTFTPASLDQDDEDLDTTEYPSTSTAAASDELIEDNVEARVEVEDELADLFEDEASGSAARRGGVERTVLVNGKCLSKSRTLSNYAKDRTFPSSTDRLKRVQNIERYSARTIAGNEMSTLTDLGDPDSAEQSIVVHDPIATLLWSDAKIWLCIGEVIALKMDGKAVDGIAHHLLEENCVRVSFQLLGLRPSTMEEDPSAKYNWRTHTGPSDSTFSIPGCLLEVLNPTIASLPSKPSEAFYLLDSTFLIAVSAGLLAKMSLEALKIVPKIPRSNVYPYRELSGA